MGAFEFVIQFLFGNGVVVFGIVALAVMPSSMQEWFLVSAAVQLKPVEYLSSSGTEFLVLVESLILPDGNIDARITVRDGLLAAYEIAKLDFRHFDSRVLWADDEAHHAHVGDLGSK